MAKKLNRLLLVLSGALVFGTIPLTASAQGNVFMGFTCGMCIPIAEDACALLITSDSFVVVADNGNVQLHCYGDIPEPFIPDRQITIEDLGCTTGAGFAPSSRNTATPGGVAILTCQLNGSN